MAPLVLLLIAVVVGWLVFSSVGHRTAVPAAEQSAVGNRDRLAYLVADEMRRWEADDPARVGWGQ
jgi:hypothetical protein